MLSLLFPLSKKKKKNTNEKKRHTKKNLREHSRLLSEFMFYWALNSVLCAHVWPFYLDSSALCAERRVFYILFYFIYFFRTQIQSIRVCKHIYIVLLLLLLALFCFCTFGSYLFRLSLSLSVISCIIVLWFLSRTYSSTHNIQCFRLVVTICFCFDFFFGPGEYQHHNISKHTHTHAGSLYILSLSSALQSLSSFFLHLLCFSRLT